MTIHSVIPSAALDLGFFSTKMAFLAKEASSKVRTDQFPSLAPVLRTQLLELPSFNKPDGCVVKVGGSSYFTGTGVHQVMDSGGMTRSATPDYSTTPEYKALFLGALWHMARAMRLGDCNLKFEHFAVGLPMAGLRTHAKSLQALCTGSHLIPGVADPGALFKVVISKVHVLSQPQGCMLSLLNQFPQIKQEKVLVLDMGGGTFDWFLAERMVSNTHKSGSHPKGMLNCATAVCEKLAPGSTGNQALLDRIDEALRLDLPSIKVFGKETELAPALPAALEIVSSCLRQMALSVGDMAAIDRVVLSGGGAPMLAKAWAHVFPKLGHMIQAVDDPVYANVRGFLMYANSVASARKG